MHCLYCERARGSVQIGPRRYEIREHIVSLKGYEDSVLRADLQVLLDSTGYRMLTPREQELQAALQRQATMIQE